MCVCVCVCVHVLSCFSCVWLFVTPWTTHQAPLSMVVSRQGYWSGLPCLPPGGLPDPGVESCLSCLLHWQQGFFTTSTTCEAHIKCSLFNILRVSKLFEKVHFYNRDEEVKKKCIIFPKVSFFLTSNYHFVALFLSVIVIPASLIQAGGWVTADWVCGMKSLVVSS